MKKVVAMMLVLVLLAATLVACAKPAAGTGRHHPDADGTDGRRQARCGGKEAWHYPERNKRRLWLQPEFRAAW